MMSKSKDNKKTDRGSTMVEVLIGFTLLMILVAGFTKIIQISREFIMVSKDRVYEAELLEEKVYKGEDAASVKTDISMTESENYGGSSAAKITLDDVIIETYELEGNDGRLYIHRFADKE